jgi:hypothetical protein
MSLVFCPQSGMLLKEYVGKGRLVFKSDVTGQTYVAEPHQTILAEEQTEDMTDRRRYERSLVYAPYDTSNIGVEIPDGCSDCGTKVVKMQQLGEKRKATFICICGNRWSD